MELPDLSHLSPEEQATILSVIKRQKDEEEKEKAMTRTLKAQFENYKQQIKNASETAALEAKQSPDATKEIGQVCTLCYKTKMAEGCGHACSYCTLKFCSRCGGRVPVKSNKVMWVCNLCRKQQEMLTKAGAWHRESQSGLTLNLEPLPSNDIKKLSGSASMAQLENKTTRQVNSSTTRLPKLKKGQSEPQLAQSEKFAEVNQFQQFDNSQQNTGIDKRKEIEINADENVPAKLRNKQLEEVTDINHNQHDSASSDTPSVQTQGVRRSSTHSERRLHRQEQTIGRSELSSANNNKQESTAPNTSVSTSRESSSVQNPFSNPSSAEKQESFTSNLTDTSNNLTNSNDEVSSATITNNHTELNSDSLTGLTRKSTSRNDSSNRGDNTTTVDSTYATELRPDVKDSVRKDKSYHHSLDDNQLDILRRTHASERSSYRSNHSRERNAAKSYEQSTSPLPHPNKYPSHHHPSKRDVYHPHVHEYHQHRTRTQPYSCKQRKHQREYSSDHEGAAFPNDCCMQTAHHRQNDLRNPSVIAFDDVDACSCCQPTGKFTTRHYQHGQPPSRNSGTSRFNSTDNVNCTSGRGSNCSVYHSDMDLSRPLRHHSSAETVYSCGHTCRKDYMQRRNCSPRHTADSLHMSTQRKLKSKHVRRKPSVSSTDEEIQSTPDYSSCDEMDKRIDYGLTANPEDPHFLFISSPFHNNLTEKTAFNKTPFDIGSSALKPRQNQTATKPISPQAGKHESPKLSVFRSPDSGPGKSTPFLDGTNNKRDSGIDTGSSANTIHSDEFYKEQHPVSWQPSVDGKFLIGRMVLNKNAVGAVSDASGSVLGVKVVGGKETESGYLGAFITRVKKGSIAEKVGHLKPGDEVIMWNDYRLRGASFNEVYEAVLASKDEKLISLVVSRPIKDVPRIPERRQQHPVTESSSSSFDSQKREDEFPSGQNKLHQSYPHRHTDAPSHTSQTKEVFSGKLQVRIVFDHNTQQLYVTVVQAVELMSRPGGLMRNPYVKMYLLPDRSDISKRRTKTVRKTVNPMWDQTFAYSHVRRQDLGSLSLELTLWDLDRSQETNSHFLGEVLIDLGLSRVDNAPQWFKLMPTGARMNRISDPTLKHRAPSTGLRPAPGSAPVLHVPSPHVSHSVSQHDYYNSAGADASSYRSTPPKTSVTTSNLRTAGMETRNVPTPLAPRRNMEPVVITKESRTLPSEPTLSNSKQFRLTNDHLQRSDDMRRNGSFHRKSQPSTSSEQRRIEKEADSAIQQTPSTKRQRHSSATTSQDGALYEGRGRQLSDSTNSTSNVASTSRLSESQLTKNRNASCVNLPHSNKEDGLSKSASLGANLHEHNEAKTTSPKSKVRSSRSRVSVNDSKSTPPSRKSRVLGQKISSLVGMKSKSSSSNALESDKSKSSPRCVEFGIHPDLQRDGSRDSASGSFPSVASEGSSSIDKTLQSFIGGLGPGQIVGRQTLATSSLGELELGLFDRHGELEVQVIRGRNLVPKANAKVLPAPYVKVYLIFDMKVISKKKTKLARRGTDPTFDQQIVFEPSQYGNSLQVIVWGDYGRMDHKAFMGVVQIRLDGLDLTSSYNYGWYKLFPSASLTEASVLEGHRIGSMSSLEIEANACRS